MKRKNKHDIGGLLGKAGNWNTNTTNNMFTNPNTGKLTGFGNFAKGFGINSANIGGIANMGATAIGGLLAGKNKTGVGSAMQTVGSLASNIPGIGGVIGAGVNLLGGVVNAAFGSNINKEFVDQTEQAARQQSNYVSGATTNEQLLSDYSGLSFLGDINKSDVGSDGWFSNKASKETRRLNTLVDEANMRALASLDNTASNIDKQNDLMLMANYSAYGGPIDMEYTGVMSPFGNQFKNGGGIHIKKANRGKFTDYCGGKVTDECIARGKRSSSPAVRKRATFAANARKWKHAEGGPLSDNDYYSIMEKVAKDNYRNWGFNNEDEALAHALNDNTYDYRGFYNKYPKSKANADTHWTDEFKTVYHPTFSVESKYSGKKSKFNPEGLVGGYWEEDSFIPAEWQNKKAEGGNLFTNGVTIVGNGGTHEYLEGQEYDVTEEEIKLLKKLGYEFEYL